MKSILVVDDSTFMRSVIKNILFKHGFSIIGEAPNGMIALEKYKELQPDIVTLDITMQEMTGIEALEAIKKYDPKATVIMVSAMGQAPIIQEAIKLGAKGFLLKPFKEDLVIETFKKLC